MMKSANFLSVFAWSALGIALANTATAGPLAYQSARSLAMGGTGVANAAAIDANFLNPAMAATKRLNESDDFGLLLPGITGKLEIESELTDNIDDLQASIDDYNNALDANDLNSAKSSATDMISALEKLDEATLSASGNVAFSLLVPSQRFSAGAFITANAALVGAVDIDDDDIAYLESIADVADVNDLETLGEEGQRDFASSARLLAVATQETGVSLASRVDIASHDIAVGIAPKYVTLMAYDYTQSVSSADRDELDADDYKTEDGGATLDLGAAYQFGERKQWTTGLTLKNLRSLSLKTVDGQEAHLDRQMTVGVAHRNEWVTLTADMDLLTTQLFEGATETRYLGAGAELDVWDRLQLRAGIRQNTAASEAAQMSVGLGLSLFVLQAELSGIMDTDQENAGAAFNLALQF